MAFVVAFGAMVVFLVGGTLLDQRRLRRQGFRRSQEPAVLMSPHRSGPDALVARTGARMGVIVWFLGGSRAQAITTLAELGWPVPRRT